MLRELMSRVGAAVPRRLLGVLPTAALVGVALVAAWFLWPSSIGGCTTLTVVSGHSMEPTYYTGDLVVSRCGTPSVGDVIVYQPKGMGGARVIHRIVGGDATSGWEMKGDNNATPDPWTPSGDQVLGINHIHIPGVGRFALLLLSPVLWGAVILLAAGLLLWPGPGPRHRIDGHEVRSELLEAVEVGNLTAVQADPVLGAGASEPDGFGAPEPLLKSGARP